jgi:SAM-dependent methyltransferase
MWRAMAEAQATRTPLVAYWERRYAAGGTSGAGSSGLIARAKAAYVNDLVLRERVASVVDWGCGDGQQIDLLRLPSYLGVDISPTAVAKCLARHPGRAFLVWPPAGLEVTVRAELALSLDVVHHLVDDDDFRAYWSRLFASAERLVCVHSTDHDANGARHVRHRRHSHLAPDAWDLVDRAADPTVPGFYLWRRA